jgi:hypothetical protein
MRLRDTSCPDNPDPNHPVRHTRLLIYRSRSLVTGLFISQPTKSLHCKMNMVFLFLFSVLRGRRSYAEGGNASLHRVIFPFRQRRLERGYKGGQGETEK